MFYIGTSHVIICKKNMWKRITESGNKFVTLGHLFQFCLFFFLWVQLKSFFYLFVLLKNQTKLGVSYHRPSGWNKLKLQHALCFIGFIILVTSLVKVVTDRAWKPNFCRKTRSDMTKGWHNVQDTDF